MLNKKDILEAVVNGSATRDENGNVPVTITYNGKSPTNIVKVTDDELKAYEAKLVLDAERALNSEIFALEEAKATLGEDFPSKGKAKLDKIMKAKATLREDFPGKGKAKLDKLMKARDYK